ncbi:MAG: DUF2330 domain-containing protein [Polyangiaceae bacterium]|jgi:hypothetical protein
MRRHHVIGLALSTATSLWAGSALPCGGGFGDGLQIGTTQNIVVSYKGGIETYFFSPYFCGQSAQFGYILPIPQAPSSTGTPTLGAASTVADLQTLAAPTIEYTCARSIGAVVDAGVGASGGGGNGSLLQVIDKGQVGIFDFAVLKADTVSAFTDWLDANQYPYTAESSTIFASYVAAGWYFVAFKVTADSQNPPAGEQLCGNLGPIQLSFPADQAVVPARIAAASASSSDAGDSYYEYDPLLWYVYFLAPHEMNLTATIGGALWSSVEFSGALSASDVATHPAGGLAVAGDRLTELNIDFLPSDLTTDFYFQPAAADVDLRGVIEEYSSAACGEPTGAEPVGAEPVGAEPVGAEPVGAEPVGAEPVGAEPVDAEPVDVRWPADASVDGGSVRSEATGGCSASPEGSTSGASCVFGIGAALLALLPRSRRGRRSRDR